MARRIGVAGNQPLELKYTETDRARAALLAIEREMVLKMQQRTETERSRKSAAGLSAGTRIAAPGRSSPTARRAPAKKASLQS